MVKNIIVISSSPRIEGNSDILTNQFICGAKESGHKVCKINFSNKNINYCKGCLSCQLTSRCLQDDDMDEILEEMVNADVIVFATPVYFFSMCGQMKTFIDRTTPRYNELCNKEFYYLLTASINDEKYLKPTVREFNVFLDCLKNPSQKGIVYGINSTEVGEIKASPAYMEAYEMGKKV